ncbi:radical SAM protein [Hymenobacter lapidiphilus]|uniref:Radical SAM protein n=1 Tax=Hymenobacter lapidiphilus TaxID=2608003 RepID=A0A7Y7PRH1_9BACT|nr:radical SAM protein [Hymenobacter lapidiphilus]NVO32694.1 radical SAM protein [Hymenobacter lapidiphilus]
MKTDFNHCESVYWVFTQLCNDKCDHCYNSSGPQGTRISVQDCFRIIDNLPEKIDRLILSGGEPLADKVKLYSILDALQRKYQGRTQIMLQTNGDLLTEKILDLLIDKGVTRFDIASIDRYHKAAGARLMTLADLFESRGVNGDDHDPLIDKEHLLVEAHRLSWGYWGASEDMWLGGNWARGRALEKDIWLKDPSHNFCAILSGAKGFLGGTELPQEISIQLWKINPCCPGTKFPLGDARKEKVADVLLRASKSEIMQRLNEGAPWKMGESVGVSEAHALARTEDLQNVCKWCDEFFEQHFEGPLVASEEPKVAV